jgi:hypothetical protein
MTRYAIVRNARSRSEAEAYLPDNYRVIYEHPDYEQNYSQQRNPRPVFVIAGEDNAGWTLDRYVIPRYGSGLIACEEIDANHPIMEAVERCTCSIGFFPLPEMRERYGPRLHSPYCPIGKREREEEVS